MHGGRDPQLLPPSLALALQVCLWARERSFSLALSTFRKCPVLSRQQTEGGGTGSSGLGVCDQDDSGIGGGWRLQLSFFHGSAIREGAFEESKLVEDIDEQT